MTSGSRYAAPWRTERKHFRLDRRKPIISETAAARGFGVGRFNRGKVGVRMAIPQIEVAQPMKRTLLATVGVLVISAPGGAQMIGTDPAAETEIERITIVSSWISQTFVAAGDFMRRLSLWFHGRTRTTAFHEGFYTQLLIGAPGDPFEGALHREYMSHLVHGRYDFDFGTDFVFVPGGTYVHRVHEQLR
jgi:hypothetical protein